MIFESHAHYDDEAFDEDRKELLDALPAQGIGRVINVCAEVEGWNRTLGLMERYPYIYGAVGVHPDDVGALDEEKIRRMHQICQMEKTVAVGEIGLDYYWDKENHEKQIYWFERQLEVAGISAVWCTAFHTEKRWHGNTWIWGFPSASVVY